MPDKNTPLNHLSIKLWIMVVALAFLALDRLRLMFLVTGANQVLIGFSELDGFIIGLTAFLILILVTIPTILRGYKWAIILGLALLAANIVLSGPHRLEALAEPRRLATWTWSLIVLGSNLLGLVFGAFSLIERFGRSYPLWLRENENRVMGGTLAAMAGMLVLATGLALTSTPPTALSETPDIVIQVDLMNMRFEPAQLEFPQGKLIALYLINRDDIPHSFDVDALGIHISVPSNTSVLSLVHPTESGEFHLYCSVPGHEAAGQIGTMIIR
jgi:uncharacterized cupredoxin-like copper-binding protein